MLYTATLCLVNAKHTYYRIIILYTTKNISDDQFSYIIVRILTWRVRIRSTLDALDALFYKFRRPSIYDQSELHSRQASGPIVADPGSASGGTFQCMQFLPFFISFSYLSYLGHLSLLGLQTKTRRQRNSSIFCSFRSHNLETFVSSVASTSVHAICKRSQKYLAQKVGGIQVPLDGFP